jgi:hypothetical protein
MRVHGSAFAPRFYRYAGQMIELMGGDYASGA